MTSMIQLSMKQSEIVFAENGAIYVKASAGSGKTRVLTERVRHMLSISKKKVLALTFTNKAGQEIKERLSDIDEIEKRAFIGTFHSFCQQILENHGHLIGLQTMPHIFEDEADRLELVEQAISQTPSYSIVYQDKSTKEQKNFRYSVLNYISKVKRELIADDELHNHTDNENIVLLYHNYIDILRAQNGIDFDDLLLLAHSLLTNHTSTAALYRRSFFAICIDEAQDLNNAQYQLLLAITNNEFSNVLMVGDPNQSIYHFNGSSPDFMDKYFVRDFAPKIIELNENYRSSKSVLSAASMIFPNAEDTANIIKPGLFEIAGLETEEDEANYVIQKTQDLIAAKFHNDIEGEITFEKIVILARNKYVFVPLEEELKKANIPYYFKMTPGPIHFESEVMKIFDLALRSWLNPQDKLHRQRLASKLKLQIEVDDSLEKLTSLIQDDSTKAITNLVIELREDGSNLKRSLEQFRDNLKVIDENERRMVFHDIDELLKHWYFYAKKTDNKSLHQFKNAVALGQTHPLSQHAGITLSTVHTMKGQEFDIVFLIGMDDETFPDYRAVNSGSIELTQEKNNLYVAFTRAKRFLYVTWPQQRLMPWGSYKKRRISRFLEGFNN